MKKYYICDSDNFDIVFWSGDYVCLDEAEVNRLSAEWETNLMEIMHEATEKEIEEYGVYDS